MMHLTATVSYPVLRLIEQGKLSRRKFEDRARRAAGAINRIEAETNREIKRALADLDRQIRDEIIKHGDADALTRSNINRIIDERVDALVDRRRRLMQQGTQKAIDAAQDYRNQLAKIGNARATPTPIDRSKAGKIADVQQVANDALGKDLRARIKAEVADGVRKGLSPKQIAKKMVEDRVANPRAVDQTQTEKNKRTRNKQPARKTTGALAQVEKQTTTELRQVFNAAASSGAVEEGKAGNLKTWVNNPPRIRDTHLAAAKRYRIGGTPGPIPVRQRFKVGAARLLFPSDPTDPTGFHPEEVINCKCLVVEIMPEVQEEVRQR